MQQDHRNYLLKRAEAELALASAAGSEAAEAVHRALAEAYAERARQATDSAARLRQSRSGAPSGKKLR